jgi:hypothetical protein
MKSSLNIHSWIFTILLLTSCGAQVQSDSEQSPLTAKDTTNIESDIPVIVPIDPTAEDLINRVDYLMKCKSLVGKKKCKFPVGLSGRIEKIELVEKTSKMPCLKKISYGKLPKHRGIYAALGCGGLFNITVMTNVVKIHPQNKKNWEGVIATASNFDELGSDQNSDPVEPVQIQNATATPTDGAHGLGVNGTDNDSQISFDQMTGTSESLIMRLPDHLLKLKVKLSHLSKKEEGHYFLLDKYKRVLESGLLNSTNLKYKKKKKNVSTFSTNSLDAKYLVLQSVKGKYFLKSLRIEYVK